jgi:hypothetical protein
VEAFARQQGLALPLMKLDAKQVAAFSKLKSVKLDRRHYVNFNGETFSTLARFELRAVVPWRRETVRLERTHVDEVDAKEQVDDLRSGEMLVFEKTNEDQAKAGQRRFVTIKVTIMESHDSDVPRFDPARPRPRETWGLIVPEEDPNP